MIQDGVVIYDDGSIESYRALPGGSFAHVYYLGPSIVSGAEASDIKQAKEVWAAADEAIGLPALNPDDATVYRTRLIAVPLTDLEATAYLKEINESRDESDFEIAAEAAEAQEDA